MTEADMALAMFRYLLPVSALAMSVYVWFSSRAAIQDAHRMPEQYAEDCQVLRAMVKGLEDRFDAHVKRMAQQKSIEARQPAAPAAPAPMPSASSPGANGVDAQAAQAVSPQVIDQVLNTTDPDVQAAVLRNMKA